MKTEAEKHTPEPWSLVQGGSERGYWIEPDVGRAYRLADANLIVAATEMLAELRLIVEGWEKKGRALTPWEKERLEFARAAIAKAEGR